jgi:hypothetical protein
MSGTSKDSLVAVVISVSPVAIREASFVWAVGKGAGLGR